MKARILPPDEWKTLEDPTAAPFLRFVAPHNVDVIVVEDGKEQIASIISARITHMEGLWIKPERRNGYAFRPLWRQAMALAAVRGERWVIGGAADGDQLMPELIRRIKGERQPLSYYAIPVTGY